MPLPIFKNAFNLFESVWSNSDMVLIPFSFSKLITRSVSMPCMPADSFNMASFNCLPTAIVILHWIGLWSSPIRICNAMQCNLKSQNKNEQIQILKRSLVRTTVNSIHIRLTFECADFFKHMNRNQVTNHIGYKTFYFQSMNVSLSINVKHQTIKTIKMKSFFFFQLNQMKYSCKKSKNMWKIS